LLEEEISHTPSVTNFTIDLTKSKTFLFVHLLSEDGEGLVEFPHREKLNEVMDKFVEFYFPNVRILVSSLKHHPGSQGYLFNILALLYKSGYDYIHDNYSLDQQFGKTMSPFNMSMHGDATRWDLVQ
jgi:hypothetical protein